MASWLDTNKLKGALGNLTSQIHTLAENAVQNIKEDYTEIDRTNGFTTHADASQEELRVTLEHLEQHNSRLREELMRIQDEYGREVSDREAQIAQLQEQLASQANGSPEDSSVITERNLLQEKLSKAVSYIRKLNDDNGILNARIVRLEEEKTQSTSNSTLTEQIEQLKSQLASQLETSQRRDAERESELQNEINVLNESVAELQRDKQQIIHEMDEANGRLDSTNQMLFEARNENKQLTQTIQALQSESVSQINAISKERQGEIHALTIDLTESRKQCAELEFKLADMQKTIQSTLNIGSCNHQDAAEEATEWEDDDGWGIEASNAANPDKPPIKQSNMVQEEQLLQIQNILDGAKGALTSWYVESIGDEQQSLSIHELVAALRTNTEKTVESLKASVQREQELSTQIQRIKTAAAEKIRRLISEQDELVSQLKQLQQQNSFSSAGATDAADAIVHLERIAGLEQSLASAQQQIERLEESVNEKECFIQSQTLELVQLRAETSNESAIEAQQKYIHATSLVEQIIVKLLDQPSENPGVVDEALQATAADQLPPSVTATVYKLEQVLSSLHSTISAKDTQINELEQRVLDTQGNLEAHHEAIANQLSQAQIHLAEKDSIMKQLEEENTSLDQDRTTLKEKLTHMRDFIAPKLQAEIEEGNRLREALRETNDKKDALEVQVAQLVNEINGSTAATTERTQLEAELQLLRDQHDKKQQELERLRQFMVENEETHTQETLRLESLVQEYRLQIDSLERDRDAWQGANEQERNLASEAQHMMSEMKDELNRSVVEVDALKQKLEQNQQSLLNLQNVLEQFEASKDADIQQAVDIVAKKLSEAQISLNEFRERALKAEKQVAEYGSQMQDNANFEAELQAKNVLIGKLRHDLLQLQSHLSEAMKRMRSGNVDDSVDRKLMANLLVGFINAPRGDSKRFEILGLISSVLKFSDDEKFKVGLARRPSAVPGSFDKDQSPLSPNAPTQAASESFMDMWISFLLKETSDKKNNQDVTKSIGGDAQAEPEKESQLSDAVAKVISKTVTSPKQPTI